MSVGDLREERRKRGLQESGDPPDVGGNGRSISERAAAPQAGPDAQDGMFDRVVEDGELERALEEREETRVAKAEATAAHKETHNRARAKIDDLRLADGDVVRVGRFRIRVKRHPSRSVAFETSPSLRLSISKVEE